MSNPSEIPPDSVPMSDNTAKGMQQAKLDFEREKHRDDMALRNRELDLRDAQQRQSVWRSPLFVAVVAAFVALLSNAFVAFISGSGALTLAELEAEGNLVLEAIKTGDPDKAADNLELLVNTGLVKKGANQIRKYLAVRKPGEGASLPNASVVPTELARVEAVAFDALVRGQYSMAHAEFKKLESLLKDALAKSPDNIPLQIQLAYIYKNLTIANRGLGKEDKATEYINLAEESFRAVLSVDDDDPKALNGIGSVYILRGDLDTAERYITKALEIDPDYRSAKNDLQLIRSLKESNLPE